MRSALLIAPLLLAPTALDALAASSEPVSLLQNPEDKEFRQKFNQAIKIGAKDEMKKLVDRMTDQAVTWIIQTAESISNSPNDALYDRMAALRNAWKASKGTDFCDKMERYFSLLDPNLKRERIRIRGVFDDSLNEYWANNEKKDGPTFAKIGAEMTEVAKAFEEVGDHYYASQAWNLVGHCNDEVLRGKKDADLNAACAAYKKCVDAREKIGLKDTIFLTTKPRVDQLTALGFGPDAKGPGGAGGAGAEGPALEAGPALTSPLVFELIEEVDAVERPCFVLDELYPTWNSISLSSKGNKVPMPRVEAGPNVHRVGSAKVAIDVDGDGSGESKADVEIPVRGRLEPVVFEVGEGEAKRKMAFLAVTGIEKDSYQKIEMNLAPMDEMMTIYIAPAGSVKGELEGTSIQIFDDNLDGVYGSPASTWGYTGMTKDHFQPELDSMIVGGGKRAVPFSEYVQIEDQWFRLEVQNGGTSVSATPAGLKTGKVSLDAKGLKPDFVIIRGENQYENTFFDLTSAKELEVPVGRYNLFFGMVSKGKKKQMMKAVMIGGDDASSYDVLAGEEVEIKIGAPYGFDFKYVVDDSTVLVTGKSVCVVGRGGERYERIWNAVPKPDVSVRKAGSKRGGKAESMDLVLDQQVITDTGDWAVAWFPRDLEVANKAGEDAEVQLVEKKNKLFGKIESVWK